MRCDIYACLLLNNLGEFAMILCWRYHLQVSEAERDLEVERVLKSFKLNPWDQLGIEFATPEKV